MFCATVCFTITNYARLGFVACQFPNLPLAIGISSFSSGAQDLFASKRYFPKSHSDVIFLPTPTFFPSDFFHFNVDYQCQILSNSHQVFFRNMQIDTPSPFCLRFMHFVLKINKKTSQIRRNWPS